ncbi:ImcF-related family protein [Pseudomonas sp. GCEP-101]|uniref:ImcF-related family protein n=1 Tax=Pseudomonas sp. GCEP-101 TaxID=2974552 RepID=UPI00223A8B5C|nr:ImcF-related family protein [Pseudomonas sp. GCEP-101]
MKQRAETPKAFAWSTLLLMAALVALLVLGGAVAWWLWSGARPLDRAVLEDYLKLALVSWVVLFSVFALAWLLVQKGVRRLVQDVPVVPSVARSNKPDAQPAWAEVRRHLRDNYGYFWRRHVRVLLVVGEPDEITATAPGLGEEQRWLEGQGTLLLWGGSLQGEWQCDWPTNLRKLCGRQPLDGVVWALTAEQRDECLGHGVGRLRTLAQTLRWQTPLYLWQVAPLGWPQEALGRQAVGCLLARGASAGQIEQSLRALVTPLRERGLEQMAGNRAQDFLLRLSRDLQAHGIHQWRDALALLMPSFARGVPLRGLLFAAPQEPVAEAQGKNWWPPPAWESIRHDEQGRGRTLGWTWLRGTYAAVLGLAGLCLLALLLSFASNRAQIATVQATLAMVSQPGDRGAQLIALNELTRELGRLEYQRVHGVPWYQRVGLSQNDALLASLWPRYAQANNALLRDPAATSLRAQLGELVALPPESPERAERAGKAYEQLKAYLMMARPEKVDATFLTRALVQNEPVPLEVSPGLWQGLAPGLWGFYAHNLAAHPQWRIDVNMALVNQTRQLLLGQLGRRNGETALYNRLIEEADNHYAAMGLSEMVGETDPSALFDTPQSVPGVYTRQAWEGHVREAIKSIAKTRREEIDWVLSDQQTNVASELTPEVLEARLTARYFQNFGDAWLRFLNSIRWRRAQNLADVIDQLTLMGDVRQSPLIALMNTLAYQGQTEVKGEALTDSLIKTAQDLLHQEAKPAIDQRSNEPRGPLSDTFEPLLALMGKVPAASGANGVDALSLQTFLTRVSRVRLKLQQITNASDPQAMTQALAQTVFQGRSDEVTGTLDYGALIAASLGSAWSGFGQSLFVEPLNRAWESVLQPSAASLNHLWQFAIVDNWDRAFDGRYPFSATDSDASLPMLGQMIRADSGRIEQFLTRELGGVLRKQGNRWLPDSTHAQGLRFNPEFLAAVNQLSELADILYTDGGMGLSFALQAKPVRKVVQTNLVLDGVTLEYFNQMESWHQFTWPGGTDHPGASLSWTSLRGGAWLFGDYSGVWGLFRLLEQATVTPLDDSDTRFELVLTTRDHLPLTWHLQTELGRGPLAVLQLRNFKLPAEVFLMASTDPPPLATD